MWGGWGADNRVSILNTLAAARNKLDQEAFENIIKTICFYDLRAMNIKSLLLEAARGVSPRSPDIEKAVELLAQWNNQHLDQDRDGFYDHPGSAIFDRWWEKAIPATFEDWFPGYCNPLGKSAVDILSSRYMGYTLFYKSLKGKTKIDYFKGKKAEILYNALQLALKDLEEESPGKTVSDYRKKIIMDKHSPVTVLGHFLNQPIISALTSAKEQPSFPTSPGPSHNRGAVNHIVVLAPEKIAGKNITSPGNSGFVSADGTKSLHSFDQVNKFVDFSYKNMLFTDDEVTAALESTQIVERR
jgi:penicillin amidase